MAMAILELEFSRPCPKKAMVMEIEFSRSEKSENSFICLKPDGEVINAGKQTAKLSGKSSMLGSNQQN